eukprot:1177531-Prorocentrum_minimum.AAC.5
MIQARKRDLQHSAGERCDHRSKGRYRLPHPYRHCDNEGRHSDGAQTLRALMDLLDAIATERYEHG